MEQLSQIQDMQPQLRSDTIVMKNLPSTSFQFIPAALCLVLALLANPAGATVL